MEEEAAAAAAAMGSEGELSAGYKLVPWSSWEQWHFVRRSIFSSSPDDIAEALGRISAWRSRGCLPVPVDVTAAFVEIQQKDPFFRKEAAVGTLESEEILAMLYSMAIIRLVNCYVEPAHKKTGRSISELANAAGIPRVLVDIRHESSHRGLPSLPLVRVAGVKALEWLKHKYWDPQLNAIPDVRKEIRCRLREVTLILRAKDTQKASLDVKGKCSKRNALLMARNKLPLQIVSKQRFTKSTANEKHISKTTKIIARLFSSYPSEVVSVLLEFFHLQAHDFSGSIHMENWNDADVGNPVSISGSINALKTIITRLSSKRPQLVLRILTNVLETIEADETLHSVKGECYSLSSRGRAKLSKTRNLCSFVCWLCVNLKLLTDSGKIKFVDQAGGLPIDSSCLPKVSLVKLLRKCMSLSIIGNKHLLHSIELLTELMRDNTLKEKMKKLCVLRSRELDTVEDSTHPNLAKLLLQEDVSLKKASQKLETLKSLICGLHNKIKDPVDGSTDNTNIWTVAKSWIPCPIGMIPCSLSSTSVLPVLDQLSHELKGEIRTANDKANDNNCINDAYLDTPKQFEDATVTKKLKLSPIEENQDFLFLNECPVQGRLLINGIWTKISEEEMHTIQSGIRIIA